MLTFGLILLAVATGIVGFLLGVQTERKANLLRLKGFIHAYGEKVKEDISSLDTTALDGRLRRPASSKHGD